MRSVSELEEIVNNYDPDAVNGLYDILEQIGSEGLGLADAYQQILELVVYDILKTKKK